MKLRLRVVSHELQSRLSYTYRRRPCHEAPTQQVRGLRVRNVQSEGQSTRLHEAFTICDRKAIIILLRDGADAQYMYVYTIIYIVRVYVRVRVYRPGLAPRTQPCSILPNVLGGVWGTKKRSIVARPGVYIAPGVHCVGGKLGTSLIQAGHAGSLNLR